MLDNLRDPTTVRETYSLNTLVSASAGALYYQRPAITRRLRRFILVWDTLTREEITAFKSGISFVPFNWEIPGTSEVVTVVIANNNYEIRQGLTYQLRNVILQEVSQ